MLAQKAVTFAAHRPRIPNRRTTRRIAPVRSSPNENNMSIQEYIEEHALSKKVEDVINAAVKVKAAEPISFMVRAELPKATISGGIRVRVRSFVASGRDDQRSRAALSRHKRGVLVCRYPSAFPMRVEASICASRAHLRHPDRSCIVGSAVPVSEEKRKAIAREIS